MKKTLNSGHKVVYSHLNRTVGAQKPTALTHVCLDQQTGVQLLLHQTLNQNIDY